jgi:hypothetical protein
MRKVYESTEGLLNKYEPASIRQGVGAEYSATLCDLGVFMDQPTEPISSADLDVGVDGVR